MINDFLKMKLVIISMFFFLIFISGFGSASAAEIDLKYLPPKVGQSPVSFVSWFYGFSLGLVGIAVFGVIIYGAILYTVSAGNASKQADAKEWITAAIWGLLLLLAAYLILWTINKDIVDLNKIQSFLEKKVEPTQTTPFQGGGGTLSGVGTGSLGEDDGGQKIDDGGAVVGGSDETKDGKTCYSCVDMSDYGIQCKDNCKANSDFVGKVKPFADDLNENGLPADSWRVTEAWPPTVQHKAQCHNNGTCVDVNFTSDQYRTPENINKVATAADQNGLNAVYEVKTEQRKQELQNAGVKNVIVVSGITAEHFSVYEKK